MDTSDSKTQQEMEIQALKEEIHRLQTLLQDSTSKKDQEINRLNRCNAELTESMAEQTTSLKCRLNETAQMCQQLAGQLEQGQSSLGQQRLMMFDAGTWRSRGVPLVDQVTTINTQLQELNARFQTMKQRFEALEKEHRKTLQALDTLHAENGRLLQCKETVKGKQVLHVLQGFELKDSDLLRVKSNIASGLRKGLGQPGSDDLCRAHITILPTHVRPPTDGRVNREVLVLDIDESQLRIKLHRRDQVLHSQTVDLETHMEQGDQGQQQGSVLTGQQLFDKITAELETFLRGRGLLGRESSYATSIIFRFPVRLDSLATGGRLLSPTKEFQCRDAEGNDLCQLFTEAIRRREVTDELTLADFIHLEAVVNDTVNCLIVVAQNDPTCYLGAILGSGINVCCRVPRERVKNQELYDSGDDQLGVICNTELGAFGKNGCLDFIRTSFDKQLDEQSCKPGEQILEKMTSAKYLPELVRLIVKDLACRDVLFKGLFPQSLSQPYSFKSKYISEIEGDIRNNCEDQTRQIFEELGLQPEDISTEDCGHVKEICRAVVKRAARLAAAGIAGVMEVVGAEPIITVAMDGDLYRMHPLYRETFHAQLDKFVDPQRYAVTQVPTKDSSTGAAIVANDQLLQPPGRFLHHCRSGSNSSFNSEG